MPRYDYRCEKCDHIFEVSYSTFKAVEKQEPKVACPKCECRRKERQFPKSTSHVLKGKGWYRDGYGK